MSNVLEKLPVFQPESVIWLSYYFGSKKRELPNGFARPVRTNEQTNQLPLLELLERCDEDMQKIARRCGAIVLPHAWGLIRAPYSHDELLGDDLGVRSRYIHPEVPPGMVLGAQVERIHKPRKPSAFSQERIKETLVDYYAEYAQSDNSRPCLSDMRPAQFSQGRLASQGRQPVRVLHDIEPLMSYNTERFTNTVHI